MTNYLLISLFSVNFQLSRCTAKALSMGPMALTSMIASFSLLIPFSFGIIFWSESLTILKLVGIILLLLSIFLINSRKESGFSAKWLFYALATLLLNGFCSVIQKLHQLSFPTLYKTEFMFWSLLCVSLILTVTNIIKRAEKQKIKFSLLGTASGVGNCVANYIVLYLSATENASVLFPIISVINIIAVWLFGIIFFKEKLKALQSIGLVIGIASVILLKI